MEYDYQTSDGVISLGGEPPEQGGQEYGIYRRAEKRRVYRDDGALESSMEISIYQVDGTFLVKQLDQNGQLLSASIHYFSGSAAPSLFLHPMFYSFPLEGKEYKTEKLAADGVTVLQRIEHTWQQREPISGWQQVNFGPEPDNDPRVIETVTTLADANLVSKQTFGYDQYNNQTDVYEYDFGTGASGPLIRRIHIPYLTTNGNQGNVNYATDLNIHIRNLPIQQLVYDASGNLRSHKDFIYDYYGAFLLVDRPGIVQHDGGFHAGYGIRGNLTGVILRNPGGAPAEIHLHNQYDIAGNLVKAVDGHGIPTDFYFDDNFGIPDEEAQSNSGAPELAGGFTYAFPTKVSNVLNHTAYTQYDYYLGKPVNSQDANGIVSSVTYNDVLDRPTETIQARYKVGIGVPAERRQTTFTYNDTDRVITMRSDLNTFGDNTLIAKSFYDGHGRTWRSAAYEGSTWTITDTRFDALGRVSQVSNPYRAPDPSSASPPSGLWTTTDYDALGRVTRVTTPDGAQVDTAYNGNQVTVTDQAGKKRRSKTNALGHLVQVVEDPDEVAYQTNYSYDTLGNLTIVNQGGQQYRYFFYDSLSRLTRAKNSEQSANSLLNLANPPAYNNNWSTAYSYDANGNLKEKIDARNITTTYGYDAFNRNTTVSYSDSTPSITHTYDTAMLGKGRLQKTETAGSVGSRVTINAYDAMGRPLSQSQQFFHLGAWGTSYTKQQTYDLAGNVTTLTYPSGHTVNYSYDQAGRLSSFSGNLGGSPGAYADTISYNAAGQMIKERFGTNTSLYHNSHYNNRLQLVSTRVGDSATDEWNWSRGSFAFFYGSTAAASGNVFANDTDNNGNLRRQINWVPLAGGGDVIPQLDDYTYDGLNRISSFTEAQRGSGGQLTFNVASQSFSYDPYGNRQITAASGGVNNYNPGYDLSTNRINQGNRPITSRNRGFYVQDFKQIASIPTGPQSLGLNTAFQCCFLL